MPKLGERSALQIIEGLVSGDAVTSSARPGRRRPQPSAGPVTTRSGLQVELSSTPQWSSSRGAGPNTPITFLLSIVGLHARSPHNSELACLLRSLIISRLLPRATAFGLRLLVGTRSRVYNRKAPPPPPPPPASSSFGMIHSCQWLRGSRWCLLSALMLYRAPTTSSLVLTFCINSTRGRKAALVLGACFLYCLLYVLHIFSLLAYIFFIDIQ